LEAEGEAEYETLRVAIGQRRRKSLTIDLRRFKGACVDKTMAEEVLALIERRLRNWKKGQRRGD
jgi:hypothetical protein